MEKQVYLWKHVCIQLGGPYSSKLNLRSKRSPTARTKFGRAKNGARAKKVKERGGGGDRRERLPANPSILKNSFVHERGS